jgi:hypothetical protein
LASASAALPSEGAAATATTADGTAGARGPGDQDTDMTTADDTAE